MHKQRWIVVVGILALGAVAVPARSSAPSSQASAAPTLSDREFWRLVEDFSEPNGYFDSDNLISNEDTFQSVIPELARTVKPGAAYVGVGPDQNFAYILAVSPRISFIADIRRGNLHVHLMYKALLELSADRADFMSRLFGRPRPVGLGPSATADELFRAYDAVPPSRDLYDRTLRAVMDDLTTRHGYKLQPGDADGIAYVTANFFDMGPGLRFVSSRPGNRYPTYEQLQTATDGRGVNWGYLSTEDRYRRLKAAEEANAIVPLVGNFAGPHALRAVGAYLAAQHTPVGVFYTSNVEQYLFQDGLWNDFAANVRTLPLDEHSTFIRSCFNSCTSFGGSRAVSLLDSMTGLLGDAARGRVSSYWDVLAHSHN
jgi:hypothetical protein